MYRPKIKIELDAYDWVLEGIGFLCVLLMIGLPLYYFKDLPEIIPMHFNASGNPDDFSSKNTLLVIPLIGSLLYVGLLILSRYPHIFNYPREITEENVMRQYRMATRLVRILNTVLAGSILFVTHGIIQTSLEKKAGLGSLFIPLVLVLVFGTIAIYLYRTLKKT